MEAQGEGQGEGQAEGQGDGHGDGLQDGQWDGRVQERGGWRYGGMDASSMACSTGTEPRDKESQAPVDVPNTFVEQMRRTYPLRMLLTCFSSHAASSPPVPLAGTPHGD